MAGRKSILSNRAWSSADYSLDAQVGDIIGRVRDRNGHGTQRAPGRLATRSRHHAAEEVAAILPGPGSSVIDGFDIR